jgi:hypothetical protein
MSNPTRVASRTQSRYGDSLKTRQAGTGNDWQTAAAKLANTRSRSFSGSVEGRWMPLKPRITGERIVVAASATANNDSRFQLSK